MTTVNNWQVNFSAFSAISLRSAYLWLR